MMNTRNCEKRQVKCPNCDNYFILKQPVGEASVSVKNKNCSCEVHYADLWRETTVDILEEPGPICRYDENTSHQIEEIDESFRGFSGEHQIKALAYLTRFREFAFCTQSPASPRSVGAVIPTFPAFTQDYGWGFVKVRLTIRHNAYDDKPNTWWVVLSFSNVDDGSLNGHGPKESQDKAISRFEKSLVQLQDYQRNASWPDLETLKQDFRPIGLYFS